eukprot:6691297-Prymnesium_polylepis.1
MVFFNTQSVRRAVRSHALKSIGAVHAAEILAQAAQAELWRAEGRCRRRRIERRGGRTRRHRGRRWR